MAERAIKLIGRASVGCLSVGMFYLAFLPSTPSTPRWVDLLSSFMLFMYGCWLLRWALGVRHE